VLFPLS